MFLFSNVGVGVDNNVDVDALDVLLSSSEIKKK